MEEFDYENVSSVVEEAGLRIKTEGEAIPESQIETIFDGLNSVDSEVIFDRDEIEATINSTVKHEYDDNQKDLSPVKLSLGTTLALKATNKDERWSPIKFIGKGVSTFDISVNYNYLANIRDGEVVEEVMFTDMDISDIEGDDFSIIPQVSDNTGTLLNHTYKYMSKRGYETAPLQVGKKVVYSKVVVRDEFTSSDILQTTLPLKSFVLKIANGTSSDSLKVPLGLLSRKNLFQPSTSGDVNEELLAGGEASIILKNNMLVMSGDDALGTGAEKAVEIQEILDIPDGTVYVGTISFEAVTTLKYPSVHVKMATFTLSKKVVGGIDTPIPDDDALLTLAFTVEAFEHDALLTNTNHRMSTQFELDKGETYQLVTRKRPSINKEIPTATKDRRAIDNISKTINSISATQKLRMSRAYVESLPAHFAELKNAKLANLKLNVINAVNFRITAIEESHDMDDIEIMETRERIPNKVAGLQMKIETMVKTMIRESGWEHVLKHNNVAHYEIVVKCNKDIDLKDWTTQKGVPVKVSSDEYVGKPVNGYTETGDVWISFRAINGPKFKGIDLFSPAVILSNVIDTHKGTRKNLSMEVDYISGEPYWDVNHLLPILGMIKVSNYK